MTALAATSLAKITSSTPLALVRLRQLRHNQCITHENLPIPRRRQKKTAHTKPQSRKGVQSLRVFAASREAPFFVSLNRRFAHRHNPQHRPLLGIAQENLGS
ncbi:MAG: hypothetical protein ACKVOP_07615 [Sphingomonadaceae bacterium]